MYIYIHIHVRTNTYLYKITIPVHMYTQMESRYGHTSFPYTFALPCHGVVQTKQMHLLV